MALCFCAGRCRCSSSATSRCGSIRRGGATQPMPRSVAWCLRATLLDGRSFELQWRRGVKVLFGRCAAANNSQQQLPARNRHSQLLLSSISADLRPSVRRRPTHCGQTLAGISSSCALCLCSRFRCVSLVARARASYHITSHRLLFGVQRGAACPHGQWSFAGASRPLLRRSFVWFVPGRYTAHCNCFGLLRTRQGFWANHTTFAAGLWWHIVLSLGSCGALIPTHIDCIRPTGRSQASGGCSARVLRA